MKTWRMKLKSSKFQWKSESNMSSNNNNNDNDRIPKHRRSMSFAFRGGKAFQRVLFKRQSAAKDSFPIKSTEQVHDEDEDDDNDHSDSDPPALDITWSPTMDESSSEDESTHLQMQPDVTSVNVPALPSPPTTNVAVAIPSTTSTIEAVGVDTSCNESMVNAKPMPLTTKGRWIGWKLIVATIILTFATGIVLVGNDLSPTVAMYSKNILCAPILPGSTLTAVTSVDPLSFYAPWWVPTPTSSLSSYFSKSVLYSMLCSDRTNTSLHIMPFDRDTPHMTVTIQKINNDDIVTNHQEVRVTNFKLSWDGLRMYMGYSNSKRDTIIDAPWGVMTSHNISSK
jgi:hypothetical protein